MGLSPDQLAIRAGRIPATDAAAIVGFNPYRNALSVFLEQTGRAEPFHGNRKTKWGERLEPLVIEDYEEHFGVRVENHGTLIDPVRNWACATPDGLVFPRGARTAERGLEVKCHDRDQLFFGGLAYGEEGTDEVPLHELGQAMWGMACTGLPRWDLEVFLDNVRRHYTIERDDELIGMMRERCERFLVDNIRADREPEPDGSKQWDDHLKRKWKENRPDLIAIDDRPELLALRDALRDHRDRLADLELATDAIEQTIKREIGDRAGFTWFDVAQRKQVNITWKFPKDGVRDDNKTTAAKIREHAALIASANAEEFARAADILRSFAELRTDEHDGAKFLANDTDEMPVDNIADVIDLAFRTLREIAEFSTIKTTVAGGRTFNVPRFWKKTKPKDDRSDGNNTEEQ
jgi:putative phage-type endonuclease